VATVTYRRQPAVEWLRGSVPLAGSSHLYTVEGVLWPHQVERCLGRLVGDGLTMGGQSLHVCCGASQLGDVRLDLDACHSPDVLGDGARLPFPDDAFDVLLCDPPYTGRLQWNHDLLSELARVARRRLVFQHWYVPATAYGYYRECRWKFALTELYLWLPRTYFGRAQVVSVWDRRWGLGPEADGRM